MGGRHACRLPDGDDQSTCNLEGRAARTAESVSGNRSASHPPLSRAYEAPFRCLFKISPRAMPSRVPTLPLTLRLRRKKAWSSSCNLRSVSACSQDDPVTSGEELYRPGAGHDWAPASGIPSRRSLPSGAAIRARAASWNSLARRNTEGFPIPVIWFSRCFMVSGFVAMAGPSRFSALMLHVRLYFSFTEVLSGRIVQFCVGVCLRQLIQSSFSCAS